MKIYAYLSAIAAGFIIAGCADNSDTPKNPEPEVCPVIDWAGQRPLKEVAAQNVGKANGFALDLFRTIYKSEKGNLCISPTSVLNVFAMMANGDDGATRDEILKILGYGRGEKGLEDLNVYCNALLVEATDAVGDTKCEFTNSIWYESSLPIMPQFASDIQNIFHGSIFPIWLGNEYGKNAVNEFVNEQTHGMIPQMLAQPMDVRLAFLNTTYFKGGWKTEFDKKYSSDEVFYNADGTESEATYMNRHDYLTYCAADYMKGVVLPYAGDRYTMTVIQPDGNADFDTMLSKMTPSKLVALQESAKTKEVYLSIPKFEAELNIMINPYLMKMGFNKIFYPGISSASDHYLQLTEVVHAVKIKVDEEGTEAAAATIAGLTDSISEYEIMTFDQPFLYIIKDNISDTILFMGAITSF